MKALGIQSFCAIMITVGCRWIKLRSWKTGYREWMLVCISTARDRFERALLTNGHAIAITELADIRKYNDETGEADAFLYDDETFGRCSRIFNRVTPIVPFPVKDKLHLFEVERELDDLEPIDIDYGSKQYDVDVAARWRENGFIGDLGIFGEE